MGSRWAGVMVALLASTGSYAQDRQPAETSRVLLATVVDARGGAQLDLGPDDFVVAEGGQEREILDVHIADYPVVVVVDDAPVNAPAIAAIKEAVARFIGRIGERPVAVGTLTREARLIASFDDSRADVLARVAELTVMSSNTAAALPAVANAARLLHDTQAPFSAIVVVTARPIDATQLVQGELLPLIVQSGAAVHVIESRASSRDEPAIATPDLLRVLSEQTHGQYTTIFSSPSFRIALDRLADRLAAELMVEYLVPRDGRPGDVRVGVRRPGARVLGLGVSR